LCTIKFTTFNLFIPTYKNELKRNLQKAAVVIFTYKKTDFLCNIIKETIKYNPPKIYFIIDYSDSPEIIIKQKKIRQLISSIKTQAKVTVFSPSSHQSVKQIFDYGLNEVFKHEQEAIILEDDTMPSPLFFEFCSEMLVLKKHESRIGAICGCNLDAVEKPSSYFLSNVALPFWGWATWKHKWSMLERTYDFWLDYRNKNTRSSSSKFLQIIEPIFDRSVNKDKSWDVRWSMFLLANDLQTILPSINLISNKGFTEEATYTNIENSQFANLKVPNVNFTPPYKQIEDTSALNSYHNKISLFIQDIAKRNTTNEKATF
tara:strand:- start:49687 stop:50637 length:951 start_codon:yes stop_codon:yes gene_type:complete